MNGYLGPGPAWATTADHLTPISDLPENLGHHFAHSRPAFRISGCEPGKHLLPCFHRPMPGNSTEGFFTILARITPVPVLAFADGHTESHRWKIEDLPHLGRFRDDRSLGKIPTIRLGLGSRTDYFSIQLA